MASTQSVRLAYSILLFLVAGLSSAAVWAQEPPDSWAWWRTDDREAVASPDTKDIPAASNPTEVDDTHWYHGPWLPLSISFFPLVGIVIIYHRVRRNRSHPSAVGSHTPPAFLQDINPPDTTTGAGPWPLRPGCNDAPTDWGSWSTLSTRGQLPVR